MEPFIVSCGYGYYKEIPALYYMKAMKILLQIFFSSFVEENLQRIGIEYTAFKYSPKGMQTLWEKVAIKKSQQGRPLTLAHRHPESGIWASLHLQDNRLTYSQIEHLLENEVNNLGGHVEKILFHKSVPYFPYYTSKDLLQLLPFDKIQKWQRQRGTYYIGSWLNFESLEHTAEYAKHIVLQNF